MKMRGVILIAIALVMLCGTTMGAESAPRKKVALVLSGGGAKGVAHIGVLKVLQEAGIPVDYVAGTSMGAIVGGLYSIGYTPELLDSIVRHTNWVQLFLDRVPRQNMTIAQKQLADQYILSVPLSSKKKLNISGLMSGQNVLNLLSELTIGYHNTPLFSELPIPFACVAYNMVDGKDVVLNKGDLPLSIRASMSIPGVFDPIKMDGQVLVDGGVANNFPTNVAKEMGADIIIGVDVGAGIRNADQLNSLPELFDQLTTFTGLESYNQNIKLATLYIKPNIEPYSAASFTAEAIDSLINRGEVAARAKWDQLMALKREIGVSEEFMPTPIPLVPLSDRIINIGEINFEGLKFVTPMQVDKIVGLKPNSQVSAMQLHSAVSKMQGSGLFARVSYVIDEIAPYNLTFMVSEYSRNSINLGLRFDTEEMAAILFNATMATKSRRMSEFGLTTRLSENPFIKLGYTLGATTQEQINFSYKFRYNDTNLYRNGRKFSTLDYYLNEVDLNFSNIRLRDLKVSVGMKYEYYDFNNLYYEQSDNKVDRGTSQGLISYYADMLFDSYDEYYYPSHGLYFNAGYNLVTSNFATYRGHTPFSVARLKFGAALSVSPRVSFLPQIYGRVVMGKQIAYSYKNFIGGNVSQRYIDSQQAFIGIRHIELTDNSVLVTRLDFRVRLWQKHYASLKGNYGIVSNKFAEFNNARHLWGGGFGYSYNSAVGPIELLIDTSSEYKKVGIYFNFGYYF